MHAVLSYPLIMKGHGIYPKMKNHELDEDTDLNIFKNIFIQHYLSRASNPPVFVKIFYD